MSTTALDFIKGALKRINSYQPGEQIAVEDANDALETMNDLLDSWSTQDTFVYGTTENVFPFQTNKYMYTIGPGGDFNMARPLRITSAFTRITTGAQGLDYPIEQVDQARYTSIGVKTVTAPWPILFWYNSDVPLGRLYFYQSPASAGELHLFTDVILTTFTSLNQVVVLPQGYARWIKWGLARELAPEYGMQWGQLQEKAYAEARDYVRSLNEVPVPLASYDVELVDTRRADAGWILTGGFNSNI